MSGGNLAFECLVLAARHDETAGEIVRRANDYLAFVENASRKPSIFDLIRIGRQEARSHRLWS